MAGLLNAIKPYARALKHRQLWRSACREARHATSRDLELTLPPFAFVFGCGRSGTTVLGQIFSQHPQVRYLFEPYHLWAAVDSIADALQLFTSGDARILLDDRHLTIEAKQRFTRLMYYAWAGSGANVLIEKTPFNIMRIGYLEALQPEAKYAHIIRDGVDVARSIERIAMNNSYRIAGKANLHQWWGMSSAKWHMLARDGAEAGYFPDEVERLTSDAQRGAYEWLVSLGEADRWRGRLGGRLFEFTYRKLTTRPGDTLMELSGYLNLNAPAAWLDAGAALLGPERRNPGDTLRLPPRMAESFNQLQERFGFANRAKPE